MSELAFHNNGQMNLNPYQDPMGKDAHQGLERFMQKFHQPGVPSHTIITDPDYYVFLWFHNAIGSPIECPYTKGGNYVPKLRLEMSKDFSFDNINAKFEDGIGINGNGQDSPQLPSKCLDLTPFVRQAQLPEIAPANATKIKTLFGETTAGTFSPYVSDGSKSITLQMIDTEYCILDAIFYPWMQDINSPWWYRPDQVYTEWATPYPMATLEVQRPRMRYRKNPQAGETRGLDDYVYYSYRFIGVKPTNYTAFPVESGGTTNLLRTLNLVADMCIVDILGDAHLSTNGMTNFGNRKNFIFVDSPIPENQEPPRQEQDWSKNDRKDQMKKEQEKAKEDKEKADSDAKDNAEDIDQQKKGDQPGEDEPEEPATSDPNGGEIEKEKFMAQEDPNVPPDKPQQGKDPNSSKDDNEQEKEAQNPKPEGQDKKSFNQTKEELLKLSDEEFNERVKNSKNTVLVDHLRRMRELQKIQQQNAQSSRSAKISEDAEHFFDAISKALNEDFEYPGKMTLGMVTPGHIGTMESDKNGLETVVKLGDLDNRMSASLSSLTNDIQVQGDRITQIMQKIGNPRSDLVGLTNQLKECNLRNISLSDKIGKIDEASEGISSHLTVIGKLAKSVQDLAEDYDTPFSVQELGGLIGRMVTSSGNKSTPIETYAEMATKKDAKNATRE